MRIGLRIFLGYFLIVALAALLLAQVFVREVKPGVRQAMEHTLVDTANLLAELAAEDLVAGRIDSGVFAAGVRAVGGRATGAEVWGERIRGGGYRIYVTDADGIVVFDSAGRDVGRDYSRWNDVYLTLRGRYGARSTREDPEDDASSVMHVAAPVMDGGRIVGVLTVAKPNRTIAPVIARSESIVIRWGLVLMGAALLIGVMVAWWLARQLGGLRRYADAVTAGRRASLPDSAGEFADLGRALHTMRERLEGKQYVERYVHALTHELKSPLTAIRSAAELLESPPGGRPLPETDRARFAAGIGAQAGRMAQTIDRLLALAAVEHRQRIEHPQSVDPGRLLDEAWEQAADRAQGRGLGLVRTVAPGVGAVSGDPFLLRQALVNLIDNAIDFAPAGSTIDASLHCADQTVCIAIADRGPGVPDYAQDRVFERFYSLPRPGGGDRSSGIGLAFVAEVAKLHGGSAQLDNREQGGAVATLRLPARRPA